MEGGGLAAAQSEGFGEAGEVVAGECGERFGEAAVDAETASGRGAGGGVCQWVRWAVARSARR